MFNPDNTVTAPRILLCHKQKTSARLHFLRFPHGVLAFAPLPDGISVTSKLSPGTIRLHPSAWINHVETYLALDPHSLTAEPDFHAEAHDDETAIPIMLACFTSIDLPREVANRLDARWIPITASQGLSEAELELLRLAYEHLIG